MFFIFPFIFISRRGILIKHLNDECLAQLGEHFLDVEGVMGSSPLALTIRKALEIELFLFSASFCHSAGNTKCVTYINTLLRNLFQNLFCKITCFDFSCIITAVI